MTHMLECSTPVSLGYFMPAEWEPHTATWLAWPHNTETWSKGDLLEVEQAYIEIVRYLIQGERVSILVNDSHAKSETCTKLHREGISTNHIIFHTIQTNDAWIRDFGPNFIKHKSPFGWQVAANRWRFDSWGKKYPWEKDDTARQEIIRAVGLPWFNPNIVLEGGAIEVNGKGTCLTTLNCLLNPNRNGEKSREEMEKYLKDYLGVFNVIWLKGTLQGDDTDGHIDNLARFVNPTTILCAQEGNPDDENHQNLKSLFESLKEAVDQDGNRFTVIPLPMPRAVKSNSLRFPASYANFYIGNYAVLYPSYDNSNDQIVENLLKKYFPTRQIVGIPSRALIKGKGGVHCITQQQPENGPSGSLVCRMSR